MMARQGDGSQDRGTVHLSCRLRQVRWTVPSVLLASVYPVVIIPRSTAIRMASALFVAFSFMNIDCNILFIVFIDR